MKKIGIIIISALMLFSLVFSCGVFAVGGFEGEDDDIKPSYDYSKWDGKSKLPGYEDTDFGGRTFLFASRADEITGTWNNTSDIWVESITGDKVNNAVYNRNEFMKTAYNCYICVDDGGWNNGFSADIASGGGKYISGCAAYSLAGTFANGNYYNVLNLNIDYGQSWWDESLIRDASCNGKLYGISGDFNLTTDKATWVTYYNKTLFDEEFPNTDIYQLVRDGNWTIDALLAMCQAAVKDVNADAQITCPEDIVGYAATVHNIRALYFGCGERYVDKNTEDKMICALGNGKGSDVIDKIRTLTTDASYVETGYTTALNAMKNGTLLFVGDTLATLKKAATENEKGISYGLLPMPLYDENQTSYYHYVNNQATFYGIPTSYKDMNVISDFFTLFAAHSKKVHDEFINIYKNSYVTDTGSGEMFDLIMSTRTYDMGYHGSFALAFDGVLLPDMCSKDGKNQFYSAVKKYSPSIVGYITQYEEKIAAINDPIIKTTSKTPAAPTTVSITDTTVTLTIVAGCEYRLGADGKWQDSNVFTGLLPLHDYTFYQRVKETEKLYASDISAGLAVETDKAAGVVPSAPTLVSRTESSVTLENVVGCEYSIDGVTWQASCLFEGLTPATKYTFYQRTEEDMIFHASEKSAGLEVTTMPYAPVALKKMDVSIALVPRDGYEYKLGDGAWQSSNEFSGLTKNTEYTFYQRVAAVGTESPAGETSAALTVKTLSDITIEALLKPTAEAVEIDTEQNIIRGIGYEKSVYDVLDMFDNASMIKLYDKDGNELDSTYTKSVGTGCKIALYDGDEKIGEVTVMILGDLNGDGKITIVDCMKLRAQQLGKTNELSGVFLDAGVEIVDGAKALGIVQYMRLRAFQLGKIDLLG